MTIEIGVTETISDDEITVVEVTIPGPQGPSGSGGGGGGGDVTKVGTPADNQVGVWTGDGTIEGDADLTFDTSTDTLTIAASGNIAIGAVTIIDDNAGTTTLQNIDALDATTESTIESAIDTCANLTSIQGLAVTLADAGADAFLAWDDSASAYQNLSASDALTIIKTVDGSGSGLDADLLDGKNTGTSGNVVPLLDGANTWSATQSFQTILPSADGTYDIGSTTAAWNNLHLDTGATINVENGNAVITHSSGVFTVSTGDLRVTTAGTNAASVVTVGGTQTLTAKTLTSPTIGTSPTAAGATWTNLGTVTTVDINGGTIDGVTIGGSSAGAITGTTVSVNDDPYGAGWNGSVAVPTKNAVYDKIESIVAAAVGITIDGGGSVITTGIKGDITVPYNCTITGWTLLADQTGSIEVDVWKDTYANYPPTAADTIFNESAPRIVSASKAKDTDFADSPAADIATITAGDTLRFNVNSVSTITRCNLVLTVVKT